jgi:hypothetical protein
VWRSPASETKLVVWNRRQTHLCSNEGNETWTKKDIDRDTAVGRKQVQDAENAIMQEEDMRNAEIEGLTIRMPEKTFQVRLNAIRDRLSDLARSDDLEYEEDEEDDGQDSELGKLREDDEPGWVMGTISKLGQHYMDRFWQKQMMRDQMMEPGWGDEAKPLQ